MRIPTNQIIHTCSHMIPLQRTLRYNTISLDFKLNVKYPLIPVITTFILMGYLCWKQTQVPNRTKMSIIHALKHFKPQDAIKISRIIFFMTISLSTYKRTMVKAQFGTWHPNLSTYTAPSSISNPLQLHPHFYVYI
jgi:hypothetical protein